ncbi:MAG: right-handed parallel beta-helix repeat-containing protein, partial [Roseimicrobium sp.]
PGIQGDAFAGAAGSHTAHISSHTHVRAGAGLTEVDVPGRIIVADHVRVNPSLTPAQPPSRGGNYLWVILGVGVLGLIGCGTVAWWLWAQAPKLRQTVVTPPTNPAAPPAKVPSPDIPPPPPKAVTIQARINEAKAGSEVVIPEGIYEEQLRFKDGITLRAAVPGKVFVQTDGRIGSALVVEGCDSGTISGLVFQHSGSETADNASHPVVLIKSSTVQLLECTVQSGLADGVVVTGVGKTQLVQCLVQKNVLSGVVFESGNTGTLVKTDCFRNGGSGVEARFTGTSPTIQGCRLNENDLAGLSVKDGASANVIEKTSCLKNRDAGIAAAGSGVSVTIVGAVCEDNLCGIAVMKLAKASVRDCTIRRSKQAGIQAMAADGTEFLGNTVEDSQIEGMLIGGDSGLTVSILGNKVTGSAGSGIGVFGSGFKAKIEQNECLANAVYGILVAEGAGGIVRENIARGNHVGTINTTGAAPDIVVQGNITDAQ